MGVDTADCFCLAITGIVVASIGILLLVDPGDSTREGRKKVVRRRQGISEAATTPGKVRGAAAAAARDGGSLSLPSLQHHFGFGCLVFVSVVAALGKLDGTPLWVPWHVKAFLRDNPFHHWGLGRPGWDHVDEDWDLPLVRAMARLSGQYGSQTELLEHVPSGWLFRTASVPLRDHNTGRIVGWSDAGGGHDERSLLTSDGRLLPGSGSSSEHTLVVYTPSLMAPDRGSGRRDDAWFVGFWAVALCGLRWLAFEYLFLPLARWRGLSSVTRQHAFAQHAWQHLMYGVVFTCGASTMLGSPWWFGCLGGPPDWREAIWNHYPQALHSGPTKWYCLIHLALSLHLLLVSVIDLRRVDSWMLLLPHQLLSAGLLGMCYATNFVRLGISITVLHDCADMIRSLAKCCHYLGLHPWDDLLFVLLFLAWVVTRHFLVLSVVVSILDIAPRRMSCGATIWGVLVGHRPAGCPSSTWDDELGYYWDEVMVLLWLSALGLLQCIHVAGLVGVARSAWACVVFHGMDEEIVGGGSDEEGEYDGLAEEEYDGQPLLSRIAMPSHLVTTHKAKEEADWAPAFDD